ncbi:MAG: DUF2235 domain-containing protein [Magnetospirillum sp.]
MAKNLVICCDGTWNTPDQAQEGVPIPTNVVRLFNCLAPTDDAGQAQHRYYHPGVGTGTNWWDKVVGGGAGVGLDRNILSAWREICDHYQPGDRLFLFGFSRGAYTVRSLAGLIHACGIPDNDGLEEAAVWARLKLAFEQGYRRRPKTQAHWAGDGGKMRVAPAANPGLVHFLGVWDTVGALGIPDDMALLNLLDNLHDYSFHDTTLNESVATACHALAMDEERANFLPTLWDDNDPRVTQKWFPGVHSDVGGGYLETGLSNGALLWMIDLAKAAGLVFASGMVDQVAADPRGVLHDSAKGVFSVLPTQPRNVPRLVAGNHLLHDSVLDRANRPPITQAPYWVQRPLLKAGDKVSFEVYALDPWNATGIWMEAGTRYQFTATGEWLDKNIPCGPDGTKDGKFHLGEMVHLAGSALGVAEEWFKTLTGNKAADFKGTRRYEWAPWFSLMGVIANAKGVDGKGHALPHESLLIGGGTQYTPQESGYLYAFANDAWGFYGNNRGRLLLSVERL